jgi:hypothetical protein
MPGSSMAWRYILSSRDGCVEDEVDLPVAVAPDPAWSAWRGPTRVTSEASA